MGVFFALFFFNNASFVGRFRLEPFPRQIIFTKKKQMFGVPIMIYRSTQKQIAADII
jgi:hypothetical protein